MHEYQTGMIAGRPSWKTNGAEADPDSQVGSIA